MVVKNLLYNKMSDSNTIGVLGTFEERTEADLRLMNDFSCGRPSMAIIRPSGDGVGVMGSGVEERTRQDVELQRDFSCSREGYRAPKMVAMIEPRTKYDQDMLKQFNGCNEGYSAQDRRQARSRTACRGGCNCNSPCNCPGCPFKESYCTPRSVNQRLARFNSNPYIPSANVEYVPLQ